MAKKAKGGGCRKANRSKRKREGKLNPLSRFVKGDISAETYLKLTKKH